MAVVGTVEDVKSVTGDPNGSYDIHIGGPVDRGGLFSPGFGGAGGSLRDPLEAHLALKLAQIRNPYWNDQNIFGGVQPSETGVPIALADANAQAAIRLCR